MSHWQAPAHVLRVLDGDTIELVVAITRDVYARKFLRLAGVDAPEARRGHGATAREVEVGRVVKQAAEAWVRRMAIPEPMLRVGAYRFTFLTRYSASDKYGGRYLGDLIGAEGQSLTAYLSARGMALPAPMGSAVWPADALDAAEHAALAAIQEGGAV